ncbi:MAG: SusC/RagA family TonB-linked outer membrane protein [Candidatus Cryptobacteroides sp.]|jgi:TonB-linked SusC/RagA family outer membrane protein
MSRIFKDLWCVTAVVMVLLLTTMPVFAQTTLSVTGTVSDENGTVPGVAVMVMGTSIGTLTNDNGEFTLNNVPSDGTLQFSYMGYQTVEIPVANQRVINARIYEDTEQLEELVVIGYGTVRKSDLTGSVSSVSEEEISKSATSDPLQALQGRAAGVSIVSATGSPSASAQIKIRGTGTMNNTSPLFVVDGFPMSNINYLSPNDISSIEILKDASATAIYGSRGANGVVMITTKQAEAGLMKVKVAAELGVEAAPSKPAMLSSDHYAEMTNLANRNSGLEPTYAVTTGLATTDWFNEVMRTGVYQNYNVNLSGGSNTLSENFSVNYFNRQGTVKATGFSRINLTSNSTFKPFKWLTIRASVAGSFAKTQSLGSNGTNNNTIFLSSLIAPPDVPVWDDVMNYYSGITVFRLANPAGVIHRNADSGSSQWNNLIGNFSGDVKLLRDLTFSSRFGYRYEFGFSHGFSPIYYETSNIASGNNSVSRSTNYSKDWTWENILTYSHTFGRVHELTAMAAMSARDYYEEDYSASRMDLPGEKPELRYLSAATNVTPSVSGTGSALGMLSYLGRINYTLLERYLLTASFRADGSSRFVGSKKWGYFPSGAFAWKVSEEPFFMNWNQDIINSVKFRLGWGQIGNERLNSYYPYQTSISQGQYYILGDSPTRINGAAPSGLGNKDLQWETSEQLNVGADLAFLDGRLTFTGDYFIRKTDDILLSESVPRTSGTSSIRRNVGGMENRGIELTLGWKDDISDFSYSVDGNISFIKNTVTNLGKAGYLSSSFAYDYALIDFQGQFSGLLRSVPDMPYQQFYGYQFLGIFQNQTEIDNYVNSKGEKIQPNALPGDSKYANFNDDGKIDSSDMTFIGDPNPKATYGINVSMSWKNFDLSMLWQGVQGIDIFNASKFYFKKFDGRQNVLESAYKAGWSGEGSTNSVPITLAYASDDARNSQNWWQSSMYVEDGSYFRLKTLQLGYTFRARMTSGNPLSFRIYVSSQNLLTLTKYSGLDPEIPGNGVDRGQYPQPRTFILGVNFNL